MLVLDHAKLPKAVAALLLLLVSCNMQSANGFVHQDAARSKGHVGKIRFYNRKHHTGDAHNFLLPTTRHQRRDSKTITAKPPPPVRLCMTNPVVSSALNEVVVASTSNPLSLLKKAAVLLISAYLILSRQYKRILWPGSGSDPTASQPLPRTTLGCPLLGNVNAFSGSTEQGPMAVLSEIWQKWGKPGVFRVYTMGMAVNVVSGLDNVKTTLRREFEEDGINTMTYNENFSELYGGESILYESNKKRHSFLRRMVGSAMSRSAIASALPEIRAVADRQVKLLLERREGEKVRIEDFVTDYTLAIAHRQILGLDLRDGDETDEFHRKVKDWTQSAMMPVMLLPFRLPWLKRTRGFVAHEYLVAKVEEKLELLDKNGPDDSTLSKMYFAVDDAEEQKETGESSSSLSSSPRRLTRKQVIDNALILIFAGTETSASTLTVASMLLGLHRDVWDKIKAEQNDLRSRHGGDDLLTMDRLDECKYLDAVIKETMRICPLDAIEFRRTKETLVVDGKQIPANSMVVASIKRSHEMDPKTSKTDGSHMDPKKGFDPDRWLDKETTPSVFMGFGEGGRRCIGERLAFAEMKVFLAEFARRVDYDLVRSPDKDVRWKKDAFMPLPIDGTEIVPRKADVPSSANYGI